jgi:methyltransferase family protein
MPQLKSLKRRVWRLVHRHRPQPRRQGLLDRLPRGGVCAEIGVWEGDFSEKLLESLRPARLHLIDPWQAVTGDGYAGACYGGRLVEGQMEMDRRFTAVLDRFARERGDGIVEVHRLTSLEAVERFRDGELDVVYIDGDHSYEAVRADLEAYAPKVRPGGLLAGDDYGVEGWWQGGVTRAVDEFVAAGGATVVWIADNQFVLRRPV